MTCLNQFLRHKLRRCLEAQKLILNEKLLRSSRSKLVKEQPFSRLSTAASEHTEDATYMLHIQACLCAADRGIGQTNIICVQYTVLKNKYSTL